MTAIAEEKSHSGVVSDSVVKTEVKEATLPEKTVQSQDKNKIKAKEEKPPKSSKPEENPRPKRPSYATIELAAKDVRSVVEQQRQQVQNLTTKLNILFVINGALLTSLNLSRLLLIPSIFSMAEVIGFFANITLLLNAFLPRQVAISPNLGDQKFLERYLPLTPEQYQLRMMVNQVQAYNANKQRLDDVSQSLTYSAYVTWVLALVIMLHIVAANFLPEILLLR
ncbi:MAG: hypothetical protein WBG70_17920 [Spirulinaceae cyanobacterium]